ncbi:uncharacterized protein SPSK_04651 [Sporothrix schenckii 1099-18]|uniref:Uncharacterized protein n=1 Tax=Sporothrix schenckii 1099-18 TaxID=1397361 RepID=A0A0F2M1U9_SPOSC|nr:uncharacterized protein SPSK_04651 [Sporothrix schenckii 1099-18]KJR83064.1 hypothetical protein SPSK_04651 [Sporothrix schenckii 1099-18]
MRAVPAMGDTKATHQTKKSKAAPRLLVQESFARATTKKLSAETVIGVDIARRLKNKTLFASFDGVRCHLIDAFESRGETSTVDKWKFRFDRYVRPTHNPVENASRTLARPSFFIL